jgi:hypothetical protein
MLTKDQQRAQHSVLGLVLLGILYQRNFMLREDWMSLKNLFSQRHLSSEFCNAGRITGDVMRIALGSQVDQRVFNFLGAIGETRLQRKIEGNEIIFTQTKGELNIANFYLYPHEIDYGPYRHLPPCVAQVLHPFEDYFELQVSSWDFIKRRAILYCPVLQTNETQYRLQQIQMEFGGQHEVVCITINWHANLQTDINIAEEKLIIHYFQHGQSCELIVGFADIPLSLEAIGLALKVSNDD